VFASISNNFVSFFIERITNEDALSSAQIAMVKQQKLLGEKVKVCDYTTSQKVIHVVVKVIHVLVKVMDDKWLMIYVAVKTHSSKILMVNGIEIRGLCLKCVYVCVLLLHFVDECIRKCVDI